MQRKLLMGCLCLILAAAVVVGYFLIYTQEPYVPEYAIWEPRLEEATLPPPIQEPVVETAEPKAQEPQAEEPKEKEPMLPTFSYRITELREIYDNADIIGFIEIPNTNISYPVVQSGNNAFYLYHDLHRNPSSAGSIFLDYENNIYALTDDNTIIYGHNMRNGSKFHNIRYFHNENFFREHTYILLDTPYRDTVWDIFAFFHTTTDFCYLTTNFFDEAEFYEFMLLLQSMSRWTTDIVITPADQILILSTCGVQSGNNRYVVVARLRHEHMEPGNDLT